MHKDEREPQQIELSTELTLCLTAREVEGGMSADGTRAAAQPHSSHGPAEIPSNRQNIRELEDVKVPEVLCRSP